MDIDTFLEKKKEYEKTIKKHGKAMFAQAFKEFFAAHPEIVKITWNQYTPYFNDGDACVFSVCDFNFISQDQLEEYEEDPHAYDYETYSMADGPLKKAAEKFEKKVTSLDDDVFLMNFGDHSTIEAIPAPNDVEFRVETYDHE